MGQFGIGQPVKRFEDVRLLTGEGRYLGDVSLPGQADLVVVRSTHAHARIHAIDTGAATRAPGVVAVFTGADLARDGLGSTRMTLRRARPDGSPMFALTLMDYGIPRADTLCAVVTEANPVPTTLNPLGAKGAGEAGTVGALPAVMNAVLSALAPLGVRELDMPATPDRVWQAIRAAAGGGP